MIFFSPQRNFSTNVTRRASGGSRKFFFLGGIVMVCFLLRKIFLKNFIGKFIFNNLHRNFFHRKILRFYRKILRYFEKFLKLCETRDFDLCFKNFVCALM